MAKFKHIKSFDQFIRESYTTRLKRSKKLISEAYAGDVAIEELMYKIMGDDFLDNRAEILDNIYTTLGMRTINWAYEDLCEDYPELLDYQKEFYEAAETEGYTVMDKEKWDNNVFESYKDDSEIPYTVLCDWFDRYESYCIDNDIEQEFPDVDFIIDEPVMIDIVKNYAQKYTDSHNM